MIQPASLPRRARRRQAFQPVHATEILQHIRRLRQIARTLPHDSTQRTELFGEAKRCVALVDPVPISAAADMLKLSTPTVRHWLKEGVLERAGEATPVSLQPERLLHVAELVERLRETGRDRKLLDAVWFRLADQALLDRDDLQESLEQMSRGDGERVRPMPQKS